ncbi:MAG: hypothetical protein ABR505_07565 [Actinomycetota bacterium]
MAFVQVHKATTITREQIDTINREWVPQTFSRGLLSVIGGQTAGGTRYYIEVWESEETCHRAMETFMPVAARLGLTADDFVTEEFEVEDLLGALQPA